MELWDVYDSKGNRIDKVSERGKPLNTGEYHLVVFLWIRNSKNQYLISRRSKEKTCGGMLETIGGSAIAGEESLSAVIREALEELGIEVRESDLQFLNRGFYDNEASTIGDVWLLEKNIDLDEIVMQKEEVEEVIWLSRYEVLKLINEKKFFNWHIHKDIVDSNLL